MVKQRLENILEEIDSNDSVQLYYGWKADNQHFSIMEAQMGGEIPDELWELVTSEIQKRIKDIEKGKKEVEQYSPRHLAREKLPILHKDLSEFRAEEKIREIIEASDTPAISSIENQPQFQSIKIDSVGGKPVYAIVKFNYRMIIGQKRTWMSITSDQEFDKLEDNVIRFPRNIDAVVYDDEIIIFKPKSFHDAIDMKEEMQERASEGISMVREEGIETTEPDMFEEAVLGRKSFYRKMNTIMERGVPEKLDQNDPEDVMDAVEDVSDRFNFDVEVVDTPDGRKIDIRNKNDVQPIIKMLNDDPFISYLGGEEYVAESKVEVGN